MPGWIQVALVCCGWLREHHHLAQDWTCHENVQLLEFMARCLTVALAPGTWVKGKDLQPLPQINRHSDKIEPFAHPQIFDGGLVNGRNSALFLRQTAQSSHHVANQTCFLQAGKSALTDFSL